MALLLKNSVPGTSPAKYLVRLTTSFPWEDPNRCPIQVGYQPGVVDRPIGSEIAVAFPASTMRLVCGMQPNPAVWAWFKPRIFLLRPARCHILAIAIFERHQQDPTDIPLWLWKQHLVRYGIAGHLSRQSLLRDREPATAAAFANEMMARTTLKVWKVTEQELDRQQPAAAFAHGAPSGSRLICRSKNADEAGFLVGTPGCR